MVWLKNSFSLSGVDKFNSNFEIYFKNNPLKDHVMFALSVLENQRQFEQMSALIERLPEPMQSTDAVQLQKAMVLLELKQFEQAEAAISPLEKNQTVRAATLYIEGRTMEDAGDLVQAANYLAAYYEDLPSFHSVNALANVLVKANRSEQLLSVAKEYVENFPQDNTASLSLALKLAPSQPEFSLKLLEREQIQWLIERNWKLSNNIAWLYFTQRAPEKAIKYSTNALMLNADNNQVKLVHANILIALNREAEALRVLQDAKQSDTDITSLIDKLLLATQS
jgi:predicted Zn-dependent protease